MKHQDQPNILLAKWVEESSQSLLIDIKWEREREKEKERELIGERGGNIMILSRSGNMGDFVCMYETLGTNGCMKL